MGILEDNDNFTLSEDINGPVLSAFLALVMVVGFVTNLFVIIVTFCHPKLLKRPSTIFMTSLLLADLVVVVFVLPFSVIATASGGWIFGESVEEKHGVCQFAGYMYWYSVLLISVTLAILSFDRFLCIVKPFVHKRYMKPHTAVIIVVIAWIVLAILNTTPFYGFGKIVYYESPGTCGPSWSKQPLYLAFVLVIFIILIGIIMVTSIWTCCFTRRFLQKKQQQSQAYSNIYISNNRRVIGIFGSLLLVCAFGFVPGTVGGAIYIFIDIHYVIIIVVFCFYSITIGNPLVQSLFRPDVRDTVKIIFNNCSSHTAAVDGQHMGKKNSTSV